MPLEIEIKKSVGGQGSGAVTVKLTGSLDTATAPELERQLAPVLASEGGNKDLVFDLAQLKFISSAGLRVFSTSRKTLKERSGQASFIHMQPQIQEVFDFGPLSFFGPSGSFGFGSPLGDRKSTRLNSSHGGISRMPSSA